MNISNSLPDIRLHLFASKERRMTMVNFLRRNSDKETLLMQEIFQVINKQNGISCEQTIEFLRTSP
jgi:hypothetical protein